MEELTNALLAIKKSIDEKVYPPELAEELRTRLVFTRQALKVAVTENIAELRAHGMIKEAEECEKGGAYLEGFIVNLLLRMRTTNEQCH